MSDEQAVMTESAPVNELVVEANAVNTTESAPATEDSQQTPVANPEEVQGSEPDKRTKELIAQRKRRQQAEQDAAYWKGVAEGRVKTETPTAPVVPVASTVFTPPTSDQFETWEEFEQARDAYVINRAKTEFVREIQEQSRRQEAAKTQETFQQKLAAAETDDPDIRATVKSVGSMVSPLIAELVVGSEMGIDLVRYFDQNPKEAMRLSRLMPLEAAKAMGMIETQIKLKPKPEPAKKVSQAPEPIPTIVPAGSIAVNEEDLPIDQYIARRNKAQFGR
jgi:hypothetical protein